MLISGRNSDPVAHLVARTETLGLSARAATPLFDGSLVRDGACVVVMGSHEPRFRGLDGSLMGRSLVVVEDVATALLEAGDVIQAIDQAKLNADVLATVRELVLGSVVRKEDRRSTDCFQGHRHVLAGSGGRCGGSGTFHPRARMSS